MSFVIKLNSSEALSFFGLFGLFFAMPNFYQIFLEKVFPIIIQTSTSNKQLFQFLYVLMLVLVTYESVAWIIQLVNNMQKTQHLNVDFNFYLLKIIVLGIFGIILALVLNKIMF